MKRTSKYALLAASALAVAASAQAQYVNGDLLLGFKGGASDFIYDLGQASTLYQGKTWTVGASLGTQFGVVGSLNSGRHLYSTSFDSANENAFSPTGLFLNARSHFATLAQGITLNGSRTTTSADTTGWSVQTDPIAAGNTLRNDWYDPNVTAAATAYLWDNTDVGGKTLAGSFSYDSAGGGLTYSLVPEPSTFSLVGSMGLLAFAVRRKFAKA